MSYEVSDSLKAYFKSIQNLDPLSKEEEQELATKIQAGNTRAVDKLVTHNLKIVVRIANKNIGRGISVDDLIQEGNIGLYEAAKRFSPGRDGRFIGYASKYVLKHMNALIDTCGRIVRLPVNQEYERYLAIKNGEEVANIKPVKLDKLITDESSTSVGDKLLGVDPHIKKEIQHEFFKVTATDLLSTLKERDKIIMQLYFGIDRDCPVSTDDIAEIMGLTQIRVCQIISSAKLKLKNENTELNIFE